MSTPNDKTITTPEWSTHKHYPPFDQSFKYEGHGINLTAGFPGATKDNQSLSVVKNLEILRDQSFGLGQPSTGKYTIVDQNSQSNSGIWKAFGA